MAIRIQGTDVLTDTRVLSNLSSVITILQGGTGSATVEGVQTNLDVPSRSGNNATGTWGISISGTAATAAALNTSNNYRVNSFGVGTAGSGTTGEIRATNNITAYYSSDQKFKTNIQPIENALQKVTAIGGKTFQWTEEYIQKHGGEDGYFIQKNDFGVIAQDVESVFPIAVRKREDGSLAVDYEKLCSLAFQAIIELKEKIDELEHKNKG